MGAEQQPFALNFSSSTCKPSHTDGREGLEIGIALLDRYHDQRATHSSACKRERTCILNQAKGK